VLHVNSCWRPSSLARVIRALWSPYGQPAQSTLAPFIYVPSSTLMRWQTPSTIVFFMIKSICHEARTKTESRPDTKQYNIDAIQNKKLAIASRSRVNIVIPLATFNPELTNWSTSRCGPKQASIFICPIDKQRHIISMNNIQDHVMTQLS